MPTTYSAVFLGNIPDLDPTETNGNSENASTIVGSTFGSAGAPLYDEIVTMTANNTNGDTVIEDNDFNQTAGNLETFTIDNDGVVTTISPDSTQVYNATVNFADGSTANVTAVLVQMSNGDLYLFPEITANADNTLFESQAMESITLDGLIGDNFDITANRNDTQFVCFLRGTLIKTDKKYCPVEELRVGQKIRTKDNGFQTIRWIGRSRVSGGGVNAPVRIKKGALGNRRDLCVSQQHRMFLQDWRADLLFGENQVLVPAKSLVNDHSIIVEEREEVEYFHILFDQHEIIFAEGIPTESFHPQAMGLSKLEDATREELLRLFPELAKNQSHYGQTARIALREHEAALLQ
ncbi:hypothetical protein BFP76_03975 [Amylibacter kogurei]|uniref:Hedgehog/Intein (Hint) domain-containing protein n=1 Tax=Paramylibacter kogurei TaxID=1889778 RepID=A0A2G5K4B2_9RHOB|nr:Hint domain-containing protein [Amylibacter kogurei]PIB24378.1 hypothetical protein BFP76_03975 [Amylibacter kogurei]